MKRKGISVLFAVMLVFSLTVTAAAANEQEDNKNMASATVIAVNEDISGSTTDVKDIDWYRFTLPNDGVVVV